MTSADFFEWCDSLKLDSEIECRNHASRYYYGLLHLVMESFPDMPVYKNIGTHRSVNEYLEKGYRGKEYDRTELRKISAMLTHAKNYRVNADYVLNGEFTLKESSLAKMAVDRCVIKLKEVLSAGHEGAVAN